MNDYASRQRTPRKHVVGLCLVLVLHALIFWAINSGLARKFVKVIKGPVEAQLLEEAKPDIPPPPPPPPPPKNAPPPPPPAYVPPAAVVSNAPAAANAIAAVSNTPQPPAPPPPPPAPPAPPAPPPPPAAPVRTAAVISAQNCEKPAYPAASRRAEEEGTVQLRFLVDVDGRVVDSQVESTSGFKRLDEAARLALARCQFKPATTDGKPEQSWASMKYTWRLE
ncbi:energy transducer TonB [Curvibacter gracilis]|uniref:energy transducer TonB n=1 Tax=Curvibacter gracilis TaxID=230310 RepID=UPI0004846249|nr:energy transducer TonB [Curvibacter gracilis]